MSAFAALVAARAAGVSLKVDAGALVWEADHPPPPGLLAALAQHKQEVLLLLTRGQVPWEPSDWRTFYELRYQAALSRGPTTPDQAAATALECCVAEWLNQNPEPGTAGRCAHCGQGDQPGTPLVPYGIRAEEYVWLHANCHPGWLSLRKAKAIAHLSNQILGAVGKTLHTQHLDNSCSQNYYETNSSLNKSQLNGHPYC